MSPTRPIRTPLSGPGLSPPEASSRQGRTPPPAPSAAYARRARELNDNDDTLPAIGHVQQLSLGEELAPAAPGSSYSVAAGYRRARAGTMPSKLPDLAPQDDEPVLLPQPNTATHLRTSALSPAYLPGQPQRPSLRHTASSAAELETPLGGTALAGQGGRNRSGSLTSSSNDLNGPFGGSSAFGNAWLTNPGLAAKPTKSALGHLNNSSNPSSFNSPSDSAVSLGADDLNFSTLDYLGLADPGDANAPPASAVELRTQAQRAMVNANASATSRHRASTVSNVGGRPFQQSFTASSIYGDDQSVYSAGEPDEVQQAMSQLNVYDNHSIDGLYGAGAGGKDSHRPRASTIGAWDGPGRGGRLGQLASIPQSPTYGHAVGHQRLMSSFTSYPPRSHSERDLARSRESSRGPRMSLSAHPSRSGTPDVERGSSTPQIPTRSLWIGNLDVNATSDALLAVFSAYGIIESVRLLPEKTCAFVNFSEKGDAIRARDDVLNRLGGHVPALSETAPVRIGFGKIDSAPTGVPAAGAQAAAPGLIFPSSAGSAAATSAPAPAPPPQAQVVANPVVSVTSPDPNMDQSALPTRALWIGGIPGSTSASTLLQIFSPFGPVESARVLTHKYCGFVNYERLDSAVAARNALHMQSILGSDVGPIRIGFARVPTKTPVIGGPEGPEPLSSPEKLGQALNTVKGATSVSAETQVSAEGGGVENFRSPLVIDLVKAGVHEQVLEKGLAKGGVVSDQQLLMQVLSGGRTEEESDVRAAADGRPPVVYYTSIPMISDRQQRRFESSRLKEMRKKLDSEALSRDEVNQLAQELMDDCPELASDYIGNTVIQKLFEQVDARLRMTMLERIAPRLAIIGVHKNGTWAAQKIIECAMTDEEKRLIVEHLRAYAPPLMCDSLGNYVCAGTLKFLEPYNDYVYDAMVDRMWDIAQNRFGARCMRTCLESPFTSLYQKKRIAVGIILNSIPLATNPNGALLLTWLVDQSNLPGRYGLLANRFAPHVAHLCTHKLASLTVLRIITQTIEPAASQTLISAIFSSPADQTLIEILMDANNGVQVIGKILAISSMEEKQKQSMVDAVRRVLPDIKASSTPPYRQLLEAVGLPVPSGSQGNMGGYGRQGGQGWMNDRRGSYQAGGRQPQAMGYYGYQQPGAYGGLGGTALLAASGMGANGGVRLGSPAIEGSPRTPQPRFMGRMSPAAHMMSPASDPFNPFASPSIDMPYMQGRAGAGLAGLAPAGMTFEQQPNIGGLGILGQPAGQAGYYSQQNMGMYPRNSFQA